MNLDNFIGTSYVQNAIEVNVEEAVNLFAELQEVPGSKAPIVLYGSPGTRSYATVGTGPIRGILTTENYTDVVSGDTYYRIDPDGTQHELGTVSNDGLPVQMVANATQLLIISGGVAYVNFSGSFGPVVDPPWTVARDCAFLYGYFIVLDDDAQPVGGQFFISDLNDATTWDPLEFSNAPASNNKLLALGVDHGELWIFGTVTTQVFFYNADPDFPFAPNLAAGLISQGIQAQNTLQPLDNVLHWIGRNAEGTLRAFTNEGGYQPTPISTKAIEQQWFKYANPDDAVAWVYQLNGHSVYHVNFNRAKKSWRFDRSTNLWHRVAFRNPVSNLEECHRGNCHTVRDGKHIVGDRQTGVLWELSPEVYADGDYPLVSLRRAQAPFQGNKTVFYKLFELITPGGIGLNVVYTNPAWNPAWMLRWSNDAGHTWSNEYQLLAGRQGEFNTRLRKVGVGSARNRVFEVSISAAVPRCLIGAEVEVELGTS